VVGRALGRVARPPGALFIAGKEFHYLRRMTLHTQDYFTWHTVQCIIES